MNVVAHFEKVSYEQFEKDWVETFDIDLSEDNEWMKDHIRNIYDSIRLPKRSTSGSAGYDFFAPNRFVVRSLESYKIPTGIRCRIENGWVLTAFPRSGLGFKYGIRLANTVGIIDSDYGF